MSQFKTQLKLSSCAQFPHLLVLFRWCESMPRYSSTRGQQLCYMYCNLQQVLRPISFLTVVQPGQAFVLRLLHWVLRFLPKCSSSRARIWCYISCSLQHQVLRSIHCWNVAQPGLGFVLHVLQFTAPGTKTKSLPKCSSNWARICATFTAIYSNFNYWQVSPFGLNLGLQLANCCSSWCISPDLLRLNWGTWVRVSESGT